MNSAFDFSKQMITDNLKKYINMKIISFILLEYQYTLCKAPDKTVISPHHVKLEAYCLKLKTVPPYHDTACSSNQLC